MPFLKKFKFFGGRVIKTGIAVFLTAFICELLDWPPMFAVITAIVTIEPTAADSIRKAFVRFPASALGAAFSVLFNFMLGDSPATFMFVAVFTILACHKLRLQDGILVATLTGVAMISTVHDHYFSSFFVRLGTTGIGLTVSTLVNFFVIRPNYSNTIKFTIHQFVAETGELIEKRGKEIIQRQPLHHETRLLFQKLLGNIEKIETLCQYQKQEWKMHHFDRKDMRSFHYEYKKLNLLRQIHYHIGNLIALPTLELPLTNEKIVTGMVNSLKMTLQHPHFELAGDHEKSANKLLDLFKNAVKQRDSFSHSFDPGTVILYELLSIHDLVEELHHIHSLEQRHQQLLKESLTM